MFVKLAVWLLIVIGHILIGIGIQAIYEMLYKESSDLFIVFFWPGVVITFVVALMLDILRIGINRLKGRGSNK